MRRDKEPKQALPIQSARRAEENLPQLGGPRLPEDDRADAPRRDADEQRGDVSIFR